MSISGILLATDRSPTARTAAQHMRVRSRAARPFISSLVSIAIAGTAFLYGSNLVARAAGFTPTPVSSTPSWWSGTCDVNRHSGSYAGIAWAGVGLQTCAPGDDWEHEASPLTNAAEWQCTELAYRWLYQEFGVPLQGGNGWEVVDRYWTYIKAHPQYNLTLVYPGNHSIPAPGDVISYNVSSTPYDPGHVAVVISSKITNATTGAGTYKVIQQNPATEFSVGITGWIPDGMFDLSGNTMSVRNWLHAGTSATTPTRSTPTILIAGGQQVVFFRGANGNIHEAWLTSGWNGPVDEGSAWAAAPGTSPAAMMAGTNQVVFWTGANGNVHNAWFTGSGGWNGPVDEGGAWAVAAGTSPAIMMVGGQQVVFWTGANGNIHEAWFNGATNGPVDEGSAWAAQPGTSPAIGLVGGEQVVFWTGANGNIHEAWFNGVWNGPVDEGSGWAASSSPALLLSGTQQVVFFRGANGNIHEAWLTNGWNGPVDEGSAWAAAPGSSPAAMMSGSAQVLYWVGANGDIENAWFTGTGGWNGPVDEGSAWATSAGTSAAIATVGGEQIVFWAGANGNVHEAWFNTAWSGPVDEGSAWAE